MSRSTVVTKRAESTKLTNSISMRGDTIFSLAPKAWMTSRFLAAFLIVVTVFQGLGYMAVGDSIGTTIFGLFSITISIIAIRLALTLIRIFLESAVVVSKLRQ